MVAADDHIIYLEHDAEITEAIEKLKKSTGDELRIVVPTRSPLLQSVVNLKLLKKAAKDSKKDLVLVTADKAATALAGKVGLSVAKNVKAEAHVPDGEPEPIRAISPLAAAADSDKADELEDLPVQRYDEPLSKKKAKKSKKDSSGRGKIPNYQRFQLAIWGGAAFIILLLMGWLLSAFVQTATVRVTASAERNDVNTTFVLSSTAASGEVQAKSLEVTKDLTQTVQATGEKDAGTPASGTLTIKNCEDTDPHALPAGSKLTNAGKAFTTTSAVTIPEASFSGGGAVCKSSTVQVGVTAAENGAEYNFSSATFALAGFSSRVTGTGTTSGGVSKKITVLSQADVDGALKPLVENIQNAVLVELKDKATDDYKVFDDTIKSAVTSQAVAPTVGAEASTATLTVKAKYTVLAAPRTSLEQVVKDALKDRLTTGVQVLDAGLDQGTFKVGTPTKTGFNYSLKTTAFTGLPIDTDQLKKDVAGKSKKDVSDIAKKYPNVTGATVDSWPLIPNMPMSSGNITVKLTVTK